MQNRLTSEGVYTGPITGYYGNQTAAAVKVFQLKNNLPQAGVVGPMTRNILNSSNVSASSLSSQNISSMTLKQLVQLLLQIGAIASDINW